MKRFVKKALAGTLSLAMVLGLGVVSGSDTASAAKVKVKKVTVSSPSGKTAYVAKGKKVKLITTVKVTPNKSANKKVTYKSANSKIATVNGKGQVKGVKVGSTKITVTSTKNKKKKATIKVVVKNAAVSSVKLNAAKVTLAVGGKKTLKATVSPKSAGSAIQWTSSKTKVATVSAKGVVKGKKEGSATITALAADGSGKKATCQVTVGTGIKEVTVPTSKVVRVTLTSKKAVAAANITIQQKSTQDGSYTVTKDIESVKSADGGQTYDIVLGDSSIASYSWLKITISNLKVDKTKEIFVSDIAGYGYSVNDTITRVAKKVDDTYNEYWYIEDGVKTEGTLKYSVTGLPGGLKAYVNKQGTSVRVIGKFTSVENGTTAVLTGVDEKGNTFKRSYVFYIGDKDHIVGNALDATELSYIPADPTNKDSKATGYRFNGHISELAELVLAGGSGNYKYTVTGLPEEVTVAEHGSMYPKYYDITGNLAEYGSYRKAIPAGTFNVTITVSDEENPAVAAQFPFVLTLVDGVVVSGVVKDAAGVAVKNASVNGCTKADAYGYCYSFDADTDKEGKYSVRVVPGDYLEYVYMNGSYDTSINNVYTAGMQPVTKDFTIPLYKATFATVANATAYKFVNSYWDDDDEYYYYGTPQIVDAYGTTYSLRIDPDDYTMYAYLKAGAYDFRADAGEKDNIVRAYSKVSTYMDGGTYLSDDDFIGRVKLSGSFNIAGSGVVQVTATPVAEPTPVVTPAPVPEEPVSPGAVSEE